MRSTRGLFTRMHGVLIPITTAIILLGMSTAATADSVLVPGFPLKSLAVALETAAGEFDLATEISEGLCDAKRPATCIFIGEGQLEIHGTANTVDSPTTKITLRYRNRGPTWPLALNLGLLVSIAEPGMRRDDRHVLTMRILDMAGKKRSNGIIHGLAARFIVAEIDGQTVIRVEPALTFIRRD